MRALLWHRFVMLVSPGIWPVIRRLRGLLGWISRVSPEIRLENRRGRLEINGAARRQLESVLLPLDILVERAPLRVSDGLIPGYFKHAAVYLGRELAEVVLETVAGGGHPAAICRRAPAVLEATRAGVRLVSLEEILDVDSVGVLRHAPAGPDEMRRIVSQAACELGKEYDYVFDVKDHRKQFCCKLVSSLYPGLPYADFLGAGAAMVPDDFVWPVIDAHPGAPVLVLLICHGMPIVADHQARVLAQLLRDGYRHRPEGHQAASRRQREMEFLVERNSPR